MHRRLRHPRFRAVLITLLAVTALGASPRATKDPDHLIVLSTTDVKGKTSPCGCHTPKGGFARRASFVDSVRTEHDQVLLVDAGGYFPETDAQQEAGPFVLQTMKTLGTAAAGVGDRELHFGFAYLRESARKAGMPLVCANLVEKKTGKPAFAPSLVTTVGRVKVGVFGLMNAEVDLGPGRDSLTVQDPAAVAARTVAALRKQGATVIVLLSQLGKVESEDLVTAVDGIDVAIVGRNVPLLQRGRLIKNTVTCYGGEQGWYVGRTNVTLDAAGRMASGDNEMFMLGPEVETQPTVFQMVKEFEDALNDRLRLREKERAAAAGLSSGGANADAVDHYVGAEVCARCHPSEFRQWKETPHARAWQTLVDLRKDATPECVSCHVVGFQKPGGYKTADDVAKLSNVQCESCHGMGTQHEAYAASKAAVPEATCRGCHDGTTSPAFSFTLYRPHILHTPQASLPALPPNPAKAKMKADAMGTH